MRTRLTVPFLAATALVLAGTAGSAAGTRSGSWAVRHVLASREASALRYFPRRTGTGRCAIPFVFRSVAGTCTTGVAPRPDYSGQIWVVFTDGGRGVSSTTRARRRERSTIGGSSTCVRADESTWSDSRGTSHRTTRVERVATSDSHPPPLQSEE